MYNSISDLPLALTVDELAAALGIGRNTAYELVRSGAIDHFLAGRQIRISKSSLLKFMGEKET